MLVLTRRQGESIIIGEGIKLTVVSVGPGRVKIGITAPPTVRIDREEIHSRMQQEQLQQETGSDVLTAVSYEVSESRSDQNTIINSSGKTGIIKNPVTATNSQNDQPQIVTTAAPLTSTAKTNKSQPHRKPH